MIRNRRNRLVTVLFALLSLLFMQMAVAGYACPSTGSKVAEAAVMADAGMPCAGAMSMDMDDEQPNLCHAHCQADSQSADKYQFPSLVAVDALPTAPALQVALLSFVEAPAPAPHLRRTTAPPLSIRNCCFRL